MRYVDIDSLTMPDGWLARAAAAKAAVAAGGDPNEHADVWRDVKDGLAALLPDKKCWYCESPETRSDNAVDHFRPKNRVSDAKRPHHGYRWLAFDPTNFRYSCTFCNSRRKDVEHGTSGGKADRFPLIKEADRVYHAGPVDCERPMLLDPCEWDDWHLLGCKRENGNACPTSEAGSVEHERAEKSIDVYHLSCAPTCKHRHSVALRLLSDVDEAKRLFVEASSVPAKEPAFKRLAKSIKRAIDRSAPFSGEMIFLLRGQRSLGAPLDSELAGDMNRSQPQDWRIGMPGKPAKVPRRNNKNVGGAGPAKPLRQFQVVETRDGKDWVMYALDRESEMWFRYWREDDAPKDQRYVGGKWDPDWRPLSEDKFA